MAALHRGLGWLALPAVVFALYMGLVWAPEERTLGVVQRIFYFHVGSAWNAYLAFFIVFVFSIAYLVRRKDALGRHGGVGRGSRHHVHGADAGDGHVLGAGCMERLVDVGTAPDDDRHFVVYVHRVFAHSGGGGRQRPRGRLASIFGIVAFANVPLVHFSATWWRGMHPTVVQLEGPDAAAGDGPGDDRRHDGRSGRVDDRQRVLVRATGCGLST